MPHSSECAALPGFRPAALCGDGSEERDVAACERAVKACFDSTDYKEGQAAFMEKRKPRFIGA
jgi:enoyl-CoA hydratase/carnithine racemase